MSKPIFVTKDIGESTLSSLREEFEKKFEKLKSDIESGKQKLTNGKFNFDLDWEWEKDKSDVRPVLYITDNAWSKMSVAVMKMTDEIGWHGLITRDESDPNKFVLYDILFFPQTVTSATVVADDTKYGQWEEELPDDVYARLNFHGHSHVNMGVTPSSTDREYRKARTNGRKTGFYVFMIINKKFDMEIQIYDFDENVLYDTNEIDVVIGNNVADEIDNAIDKYVEKKTTTFATATPSSSYYKKHDTYDNYDYYGGRGFNW